MPTPVSGPQRAVSAGETDRIAGHIGGSETDSDR